MRISLDHYRILGVAPDASPTYIQQVYHSLATWIPHRDFSEAALQARQRVLERSFQVLTNPEQRLEYDHILAEGERTLEVPEPDRMGALLILYSVGSYQEVLELAQPQLAEDELTRSDRILVRALALQAIGLERWQQGNFTEAGDALEQAQEELMEAGLFLHLRGELQAYLFKLRPHRILHLLSQHPHRMAQAITLLGEMLDERGGIEGTGNDYSGLDREQFLHFIQEVRQYLPTRTQEQLFAEEAKRPSLVASYLHGYSLIARGFAEFRPDYIRRAQGIFLKLRPNQNVYLETALCSLLLGQTEEALSEIILSNEYDTIIKFRPDPNAEPDLLLNLCWYCERWLEKEVYPHFADLAGKSPSLKAYFAEKQVETYLEELSQGNPAETAGEWIPSSLPRPTAPPAPPRIPVPPAVPTPNPISQEAAPRTRTRSFFPRLLLILAVALSGLGGGVGLWLVRRQGLLPLPSTAQPPVLIQTPLFASFSQVALLKVPEEMNLEQARQIINKWQTIKAQAMGEKYDITALEGILVEPSLSEWRRRVERNKEEQAHLVYNVKNVEIKTVTPEGTDKADVIAVITEDRDYIQQGERIASDSRTDDQYEVTYKLLRQNDNWFIQDMIVK
ncbi:MAG: IMS domain-containing protein [Pseudanabaenaceae cyanobacterium SKYGB_i_bin29]|nr:IMS domain-containing protein [Pseudanabaenaceae cyanobacterium SKYG29]MDW8420936.1 IMS domain-containing protein [Pseudanabaenaceae cyanobacterium SKYGB_i_bin29]